MLLLNPNSTTTSTGRMAVFAREAPGPAWKVVEASNPDAWPVP
jgi:hypothetical protein